MKPHCSDSRDRRNGRAIIVGIGFLLIIGLVWRLLLTHSILKVEVVFSHFENENGHDLAVVQVSNNGTQPVTCYGYGWQHPFYWIATAKGTNWANETNWSFDYTPGADRSKTRSIILPAGAKMPVRTLVPIPDRWMVGVEYSSSNFATKLPHWVWRLGSQVDIFR